METKLHYEQLNNMFLKVLKRPIDLEGFNSYSKMLKRGIHIDKIENAISRSEEFKESRSRELKLYNIEKNIISKFTNFDLSSCPKGDLFQVVICRYNEDPWWVEYLAYYNCHVYIYNKGEHLENIYGNNVAIIDIPNIGYEDYVYLLHITEHYDNLPDRLVFLQCGLDHCPDILTFLNDIYEFKNLVPLAASIGNSEIWGGSPDTKYEKTKYGLISYIKDLNFNDIGGGQKYIENIWNHFNISKDDKLYYFFCRFFNIKPIEPLFYSPCALFSITKNMIIKNNKDSYMFMKSTIEKFHNVHDHCIYTKVFASIFERLWTTIFYQ